jgi:PPOX class probable F420-dependent enzyme
MSQALKIAQKYFELSNQSDFAGISRLLANDLTYSSSRTGDYSGAEEVIQMQKAFHGQFSSLRWTVNAVEEEKPGLIKFNYSFAAKTPTGEKQASDGIEYIRVSDGKIHRIELRTKSKLTDSERRLFGGPNFVFLATINPDGSPQVTPMWADVEGDLIVMNTTRTNIKVRNFKRDPRVALSTIDPDDPYEFVTVQGVVESFSETGAREHIQQLSQKYLGKAFPWPDVHRLIFKIRKL